ncbi:class D sortase [Tyzzerella sp. OttesenSCG-928-J15]|nr:class D sortase [Tyzzerella sp. OttesenSCG-928-J15]
MKENRKRKWIMAAAVLSFLMLNPPVAYALTSDLQYNYKTVGETEFYNTGIQSFNYNGDVPDYLYDLYEMTPQHPYNSDNGANIIVPTNLNTLTNEAIQNAPSNAPVAPTVNASANKTTYSAGGSEDSTSSLNGSSNGSNLGSAASTALPNGTSVTTYPNNFGGVYDEVQQYPITSIEQVRESNGKIGTLKIPKIGLTVSAYDGDTFTAMQKGIGHISSTSAWLGNCGLVGHNRGTSDYFGKLKNLSIGDEITYTTTLGTKTYVVDFIGRIAETDWSKLEYTAENRLTLLTCVEDVPSQRLCVQAREK